MGGKLSRFTQEELSIYESCTCLDGAELATIYEKFIKMGGRRVPKGADEASYRRIVGQKTVRNMMAGSDVSLSQVRGASPSPLSHEGTSSMQPRPVSGLRSHPTRSRLGMLRSRPARMARPTRRAIRRRTRRRRHRK